MFHAVESFDPCKIFILESVGKSRSDDQALSRWLMLVVRSSIVSLVDAYCKSCLRLKKGARYTFGLIEAPSSETSIFQSIFHS